MARKPLHVVTPGEAPPPPMHKMSVTEAAESGDHKGLLVAMRVGLRPRYQLLSARRVTSLP